MYLSAYGVKFSKLIVVFGFESADPTLYFIDFSFELNDVVTDFIFEDVGHFV